MVNLNTWTTVLSSTSALPDITYVNGYWIATAAQTNGVLRISSTTDPRGSWTTVTVANPNSTSYAIYYSAGNLGQKVIFDGTYYVTVRVSYFGSNDYATVYYATDPAGTWTAYQPSGASANIWPSSLHLHDGTWVMAGWDTGASFANVTYTATDPTGTWTQVSSEASMQCCGFATDPVSGDIYRLLIIGPNNAETYFRVESATSPSGSWSTVFTGPTGSVPRAQGIRSGLVTQSNGYWTVTARDTATDWRTYYTTDISAWSSSDYFAFTPPCGGAGILGPIYGSGYWVSSGGDPSTSSSGYISYYESTGSPDGTYTSATNPWSGSTGGAYDAAFHGGEFLLAGRTTAQRVVAITDGPIPDPNAPRATYLRQRQSPVRSPSRVSPVNLRNRQTTMIR